MRGLLAYFVVVACAGCAPSAAELARDNAAAEQRSHAEIASLGAPVQAVTVEIAPGCDVAVAGQRGLRDGEHLARAADGQLAFYGATCVQSEPCNADDCMRYPSYELRRAADGHIVIARVYPQRHVVAVQRDSSCPVACRGGTPTGVAAAEPPSSAPIPASALGVRELAQVEVRDAPYPVDVVDVECTNTDPVP